MPLHMQKVVSFEELNNIPYLFIGGWFHLGKKGKPNHQMYSKSYVELYCIKCITTYKHIMIIERIGGSHQKHSTQKPWLEYKMYINI